MIYRRFPINEDVAPVIVDSQVHIWAVDSPDRRWPPPAHGLKPTPHREVPITANSLLQDMQAAGVDRTIVVPPSWEGDRNDVVSDAVKRHPDRFRFAARYDLQDRSASDWIASWRRQPGMLALQLTFQVPLFQKALVDGELGWLWSAAERAGLPLTIYLPNALMPIIDRVAQAHPGLSIVINHFGLTGSRRDDDAFTDFGNLLSMSRHPNVAVKASCLPFYTTQSYPFVNLHKYIRQAFDAFGPKRLFWELISRGCHAPIARASRSLPRNCLGCCRPTKSGSWDAVCASGSAGPTSLKFEGHPVASYQDLRGWLDILRQQGEVEEIKGASWDLEIGALIEIACRDSKGHPPALMFRDIPGYPPEHRVLGALFSSPKRLALTLGLDGDISTKPQMVAACREKLAKVKLLPPVMVKTGPVAENVLEGSSINLLSFPVPRHHELDGGRYIGTANCVITQDPDNGWVNLGTYRCMVLGPDKYAVHINPGRDGAAMMRKYHARKQPMPVALAIGVDPALWLASNAEVRSGTSEYDYAGGLKGEPLQVMRGPKTGLPIPASAEIVIEGFCHPGELEPEGPFGEWAGYYANHGLSPVPEPVIRVVSVMHRNDPILTCAHPAKPKNDSFFSECSFRSATMWDEMEKAGVPGIQGVWCHEVGGARLFNVITIKQQYSGHSRQAGMIASQCRSGSLYRPVHRGPRRGYRPFQPGRGDLGDRDAIQSGARRRDHALDPEQLGRSGGITLFEGPGLPRGRILYVKGDHRRLLALRMAPARLSDRRGQR